MKKINICFDQFEVGITNQSLPAILDFGFVGLKYKPKNKNNDYWQHLIKVGRTFENTIRIKNNYYL